MAGVPGKKAQQGRGEQREHKQVDQRQAKRSRSDQLTECRHGSCPVVPVAADRSSRIIPFIYQYLIWIPIANHDTRSSVRPGYSSCETLTRRSVSPKLNV